MTNLIIKRIFGKLAMIMPGGKSIRPWLHKKRGVQIGQNVWISQLVYFDEIHPENIRIGNNCTIGLRTSIITHLYWGSYKPNDSQKVVIGDNVYVGPHCLILPNVIIGEGSVIKGGTVISTNIPPFSFVGYSRPAILAKVTVPLTSEYSYSEFVSGLRPYNSQKGNNNSAED
jgi:acetyltransferase-like isoleucine patch superfamily enzyme